MVSAGDFRNGMTFEEDGNVLQVVEFQHVKPGKGAAFVRTKTKNVLTGAVVEKSYNPTAKFPTAFIERKDMEYSYNDGDLYYFMDPESYELVPINASDLPDNFKFVKESMTCKILSYKGNIFGVEPPTFVELQVTQTDPGFAGNTATNATKPATVETGAEIKVPLFIDEGEMIQIDTNADTIPDFTEEYFAGGSKITSWDFNGDGLWDVRFTRYPKAEDSDLIEEAQFYQLPEKNLVTITTKNSIPIKVQKNGTEFPVTLGASSNFYWVGQEGSAEDEKIVLENISPSLNQGVSVLIQGNKNRMLAVKIAEKLYVQIIQDVE